MPSGANGPVSGSGAPKRTTSSATANDPDAPQQTTATIAAPAIVEKRANFEYNIRNSHHGSWSRPSEAWQIRSANKSTEISCLLLYT
jgi:hypothetical protein